MWVRVTTDTGSTGVSVGSKGIDRHGAMWEGQYVGDSITQCRGGHRTGHGCDVGIDIRVGVLVVVGTVAVDRYPTV